MMTTSGTSSDSSAIVRPLAQADQPGLGCARGVGADAGRVEDARQVGRHAGAVDDLAVQPAQQPVAQPAVDEGLQHGVVRQRLAGDRDVVRHGAHGRRLLREGGSCLGLDRTLKRLSGHTAQATGCAGVLHEVDGAVVGGAAVDDVDDAEDAVRVQDGNPGLQGRALEGAGVGAGVHTVTAFSRARTE
jgi:hypothetical protein